MVWENRNIFASILAIAFAVVAGVFLVAGIIVNPSVQNFFTPQPIVTRRVGAMQTFDLPSQFSYSEPATYYFGVALCNISSRDFNVGSQVGISVEVALPTSLENKISHILVTVDDAIEYSPFSEPDDIPYPCRIYMFPIEGRSGTGSQVGIFENSGTVSMDIKIAYEYPLGSFETSQPTIDDFTVHVSFTNLRIGTGQESQQKIYADLNLSLTFIVMFFACVDIAVVFYDHSEKKNN